MNSVGRVNTLSHTITSRMGVVVLSAEIAWVVQLHLELVRKGQNLTQGKDSHRVEFAANSDLLQWKC